MTFDFIIVGAGAAGLMAATSASRIGKSVLLLEKNKKLGVKILMSGGTRCNITHNCDARGIITAYGQQGNFLHSALAAFPPAATIDEIESAGVPTKVEVTGKIFPESDRAIDVRDALVKLARSAGADIRNNQPVVSIERDGGEFTVTTTTDTFRGRKILLTTGGKSYPGCGTTGDGYQWAEQFGHSIVEPVPALTPILTNQEWAKALKGVTIEDVGVEVVEEESNGKFRKLASERGSFLFTHFGFSGPAILNASRAVTRHTNRKSLTLNCDWIPNRSEDELKQAFRNARSTDGKQSVINLLSRWTSKRLGEALLTLAEIAPKTRNAELSKTQIDRIANQLKRTSFPIPGTLGFEKAEVTAGGVSLAEVSSKTMESKFTKDLFFAGEILDLDGPIGGFNFQAAFSTGYLAGLNA